MALDILSRQQILDKLKNKITPYSTINTTVDPNQILNSSEQNAEKLTPVISGLNTLGNQTVDTSGAPNTSLKDSIDRINNVATTGLTSDLLKKVSQLRPTNEYEKNLNPALSRLNDYANGNSQVDRTIANRAISKFDASSAAANLSQAQRISANPYMTTGAKSAAMAELNRTSSSQRSELIGGLAEKAQERAYTASKDYTQYSLAAADYEENKFKTDLSAASQEVTNNLNAAISAGTLSAQEISNNLSVWNTQIQTKVSDLNRGLQTLVSSGQLTNEQAKMRLDGIIESSKIEQQNITNQLTKARNIADYEMQTAQVAQINSNIAAQQVENYKTWNGLATSAVLDYRTRNSINPAKDNWDAASQDQQIASYVNSVWDSIPGNKGKPIDPLWAESYYKSISTAAETTKQATDDKLRVLSDTWVGSGKMSETAFNQFADQIRMIADYNGTLKMSSDGKTISMVDAQGNPMKDSDGNYYSYDTTTGKRVTTTTSSSTTGNVSTFNTWKSNLLSTDTTKYSEEALYNSYNKLVSSGNKTPTREEVIAGISNSDSNWQSSYESAKSDPRFNEMETAGTISATLWKESGAKTMDEYVAWKKKKDTYGTTDKTYTVSDSGRLLNNDGSEVMIGDYVNILKNGDKSSSPNNTLYKSLLTTATPATLDQMHIGKGSSNTLDGVPNSGTLMKMNNRLLYVKDSGRKTKGGRNTDFVTLVDVSTGTEQTFTGRVYDGNFGKSINSLPDWVSSLI